MLTAATIIAGNYLSHARVLADSFFAHHPGSTFIVLIIDDERRELATHGERFDCVRLSEIGFSAEEIGCLAGIYDVTELATAVKPKLLAHLLKDSEHVIYLDPDIKIFDSLVDVAQLARDHGIVLTPHTTVPMPKDGRRVDSGHILGSGVYNLGFIGLGRAACVFLDWWWENTRREALVSPERMMFTDQRWIDFVPALFGHHLLKDPGYNVAYWNLHGRELVWRDGKYLVSGHPLRFFHFSGFNFRSPYLLSKHQGDNPRILLSERPALGRICAEYAQDLRQAGVEQESNLPYGWETLENGLRLDQRSRRLYWNAVVGHERNGDAQPPNPFAADHGDAFVAWLKQPARDGPGSWSKYLFSIYQSRIDLQLAFPDIVDADAAGFAQWVRSTGVVEEAIPVELLPADEAPAERRGFASPSTLRPGVNVAGYLTAELGIGEAARLMIRTLEHARVPHSTNTFTRTASRQQHEFAPRGTGRCEYDINVVCVNADQVPYFAQEVGPDFFRGRHTAGYWFWELERLPDSMFAGFKYVDEVWAATRFVTQAVSTANQRPVYTIPVPVLAPKVSANVTRETLGLPDAFTFLFVFDFFSTIGRKNPVGLVRAFKQAFQNEEGPALIIKSINGHRRLNDLERLRFEIGSRTDIRVIDEYYTTEQKNALMTICDCYVSLHRSEGFGLTIAEAMALRKPVIATGYSGNLDFMTPENSFLVDYTLGEVPLGCEPYVKGTAWAEPSLQSAAEAMRRVVDSPREAAERAFIGQQNVLQRHGVAACAKALTRRIDTIRDSRRVALSIDRPATTSRPSEADASPGVAAALDTATALLTPTHGLPHTARFRRTRLRLQQLLLRSLRAYWWQQRTLQSALIDSVKALSADAGRRHADTLQQMAIRENALYRDIEASRAALHADVASHASDLARRVDIAERRVKAVQDRAAEHVCETSELARRLDVLEHSVNAFHKRAAEHLGDLTTHIGGVATETRTLRNRLYAVPYMTDPERLLILDDAGRPQLGFDGDVRTGNDIYDGFEDIFRGTEQLIRERAETYVPFLKNHEPILDVGCGRGELLEALRDAGLVARGIDLDGGMIARSRRKRLDVAHADAVKYLRNQQDDTFGAIVAIQFIEHLPYDALTEFFRQSRRCIRPGGVLIVETVNPHSLEAFKTFWTDLTHRAPIFPEVALALVRLHGFTRARAIFPQGTGDLDNDRRSTGEYAIVATK